MIFSITENVSVGVVYLCSPFLLALTVRSIFRGISFFFCAVCAWVLQSSPCCRGELFVSSEFSLVVHLHLCNVLLLFFCLDFRCVRRHPTRIRKQTKQVSRLPVLSDKDLVSRAGFSVTGNGTAVYLHGGRVVHTLCICA